MTPTTASAQSALPLPSGDRDDIMMIINNIIIIMAMTMVCVRVCVCVCSWVSMSLGVTICEKCAIIHRFVKYMAHDDDHGDEDGDVM